MIKDNRTEAARQVGEILRKVDQLIKVGNIDESVREIIRAREIDPKHGYISAYEERLAYLKKEHERNIEQEQTRKSAEEAARKRDEELRRKHEEERKRLEEEQKKQESERRKEQDRINANRERTQLPEVETAPPPRHVKVSGIPGNAGLSKSTRKTILIVDDDENMLRSVSEALDFSGYEARPFTSSDEALVLLKNWTPNLILCDVNLETSTMGGFSFFERVRALAHLHEVPFVFLTGLNDDVLLRTAKELGADDYLLKPVSIDNLLSTIKGKLKRFDTFQKKG